MLRPATAFCLQMQCYCHIAPLSSTLWVQPDSRRGQPSANSPLSTSARLLAKQPQSLSSVHEAVKVCFCVTGIQYLFNIYKISHLFQKAALETAKLRTFPFRFMRKYASLYFNSGSVGCQKLPQPFFVLKSRAVWRTRKIHSIKLAFKVRHFPDDDLSQTGGC